MQKGKYGDRGVTENWIKETLDSPDQIVEGYGGRKVAQKKVQIQKQNVFVESYI